MKFLQYENQSAYWVTMLLYLGYLPSWDNLKIMQMFETEVFSKMTGYELNPHFERAVLFDVFGMLKDDTNAVHDVMKRNKASAANGDCVYAIMATYNILPCFLTGDAYLQKSKLDLTWLERCFLSLRLFNMTANWAPLLPASALYQTWEEAECALKKVEFSESLLLWSKAHSFKVIPLSKDIADKLCHAWDDQVS
mgnify:CR=1 FL=1|tara:strand:+ start:207013 stop:207597 length:585 start_codon:yes stop_codon:yes gene_type:complete